MDFLKHKSDHVILLKNLQWFISQKVNTHDLPVFYRLYVIWTWLFLELNHFLHTEELYKKDLHNPDNQDGVITHLEPDILECEVKWALEIITMKKAGGGDGIPVELFQTLKDDGVKVLHSICHQIWKTQRGHRTRNGQFSFQSQRMLKLLHSCTHLTG